MNIFKFRNGELRTRNKRTTFGGKPELLLGGPEGEGWAMWASGPSAAGIDSLLTPAMRR